MSTILRPTSLGLALAQAALQQRKQDHWVARRVVMQMEDPRVKPGQLPPGVTREHESVHLSFRTAQTLKYKGVLA